MDIILREFRDIVSELSRQGATPLVVAEDKSLGVIHLKDIVKAESSSVLPNFGKWVSKQ